MLCTRQYSCRWVATLARPLEDGRDELQFAGATPGYPSPVLALLAHVFAQAADFARRRPRDALELGVGWGAALLGVVLLVLG